MIMKKFKALVCGFDPFDQNHINPSWSAVSALPQEIEPFEIYKIQLPVTFGQAFLELEKAMEHCHPDLVLCAGLAKDRSDITVERVAINLCDARIPDNQGFQPLDQPIIPGAPDAYFTNLPLKEIVKHISHAGIKASISNTAGTFVCNYVMYKLMHTIATKKLPILGGFVHVPVLPEMLANSTSLLGMNLDSIVLSLRQAILACLPVLNQRIPADFPEI